MATIRVVLIAIVLFVSTVAADAGQRTIRKKLDAPTTFDGIKCMDVAWLDENGRLSACFLAEGNRMAGVELPKRTRLGVSPRGGWWAQPPRDLEIGGHLCSGSGVEGPMIGFYPSGKLRSYYLPADQVIDGVPCRHGGFWTDVTGGYAHVNLHESGELARCEIARKFSRGGYTFRTGDTICLNADGTVSRCELRGCQGPACGLAP